MADPRSNGLRAFYEENGYLLILGLIPRDEIEQIRDRFEQIWREGQEGYLWRDDSGEVVNHCEKYPRIVHPHRFDALSRQYLLDPRITDVVRELLDDEPLAAQTMYYWKPPGTKGQALHQDNLYLQAESGEGCMAAWLAIDRATEENGCIRVVPGSHRLELQCPEEADAERFQFLNYVPPPEGFTEVACVMEPGDCLFFGGHTIHGSDPNRSATESRRSLICHYIGTRSKECAGFYNPLLAIDGREVIAESPTMGSPCGVSFDGPH